MARIGFAYNEKPDLSEVAVDAGDALRPEEEPPSNRRDASASRTLAAPTSDEFAEWDTAETIGAVERALAPLGEVVRLEATAEFPERLRAERPDIVFNMAEGIAGMNRESHVPAICEFYGVPYSGSDPFTLSLCLHKGRTKEVLSHHGVPTAPFALVSTMRECRALRTALGTGRAGTRSVGRSGGGVRRLRLPLFVKPVHEGSSKGITERNLVRTPEELEAQIAFLLDSYAQPVLVEEYLPGAEFTCAVLGNDDDAVVLPIVGMNFDALPVGAEPIYGFEAKWLWDRPDRPLAIFECPARIDERMRSAIERVTLSAYHALACRDWSRIDVRLDAAGTPHVVEVNPLPGILPNPADNSCLPKAARAAGMSYDELIQSCVLLAAERQGVALPATLPGALRRAAAG